MPLHGFPAPRGRREDAAVHGGPRLEPSLARRVTPLPGHPSHVEGVEGLPTEAGPAGTRAADVGGGRRSGSSYSTSRRSRLAACAAELRAVRNYPYGRGNGAVRTMGSALPATDPAAVVRFPEAPMSVRRPVRSGLFGAVALFVGGDPAPPPLQRRPRPRRPDPSLTASGRRPGRRAGGAGRATRGCATIART